MPDVAAAAKQVVSVDTAKTLVSVGVGYYGSTALQNYVFSNIKELNEFPEIAPITVMIGAHVLIKGKDASAYKNMVVAGAAVKLLDQLLVRFNMAGTVQELVTPTAEGA